jgi:Tfp pilus assembly protein PilP
MRLATLTRNLMPLAVSAVLATGVLAQEHVNINPNAVRDQVNQSGSSGAGSSSDGQQAPSQAEIKMPPKKPAKAPAQPAAQAPSKAPGKAPATAQAGAPAKPAPAAAAKPQAAKAPAKGPAKAPEMKSAAAPPAKAPQKPAETGKQEPKAAAAPAAATAEKAPEEKPVVRRDPFDTLLTKARASNAPPENLPPGKAGLIVESLRINGIVHSPGGMIAVVSNAQQRVYFLRDGDKLYDGSVDKIALDSISFHEIGKDAFGKPLERTVTKQLYPTSASSGEQQ